MIYKCLNCLKPVDVDDNEVGMPFDCDNCGAENFAYFFAPPKVVYFKVRKPNGETIIFGQCNNGDCSAYDIDIYNFVAEVLGPSIEPSNHIFSDVDCPECGTPERPIVWVPLPEDSGLICHSEDRVELMINNGKSYKRS